jgi:hypothetical protein
MKFILVLLLLISTSIYAQDFGFGFDDDDGEAAAAGAQVSFKNSHEIVVGFSPYFQDFTGNTVVRRSLKPVPI